MHSCSFSADDALRVLAVDGDELGEVDLAAGEGFGELQAQARGGHFRFGLVVGHAEAVLGAQLLVRLAHGAVVGEGEAGLQGIDGRAPVGAPLQRVAEHGEGAGLLRVALWRAHRRSRRRRKRSPASRSARCPCWGRARWRAARGRGRSMHRRPCCRRRRHRRSCATRRAGRCATRARRRGAARRRCASKASSSI